MLLWDLGSDRDGEAVPVVAIVLVAGGLVAAVALLVARNRRARLAAPVVVAVTSGLACVWLGPF